LETELQRGDWSQVMTGPEIGMRLSKAVLAASKSTARGGQKIVRGASNIYQAAETAGKMAKAKSVIDGLAKELGRKPTLEESSAFMDKGVFEANKWLIDYSLVPQGVDYLRKHALGSPFLTFQYKVLPLIAEASLRRPWLVAAAALAPMAMMKANPDLKNLSDEDVKTLKRMYPEQARKAGHVWLLPKRNADGTWRMLDVGYMTPVGGLSQLMTSLAKGDVGGGIQDFTGLLGGPVPQILSAVITKVDPFTKRPIVDDALSGGDQVKQWLTYAYTLGMPSWTTDRGALGKLVDAFKEKEMYYGGTQSMDKALLSAIGVNLTDFDPGMVKYREVSNLKYDLNHLKSLARKHPERANKYTKRMQDLIKDNKKLLETKVPPNLRSRRQ